MLGQYPLLSDALWPTHQRFHEALVMALKAKVHDQFGDHEFDKKVDTVRRLAEQCWKDTAKKSLQQMDDVLDDLSMVVFAKLIEGISVYVNHSSRKKTIAIGLHQHLTS